ncbi:hypothetical protein Tco_0353307 [Tanacetum coccineum]
MFVRLVWRKKLNYCNTSNKVDVNLPILMPKPQYPLQESSQENPPTTHSNHDSLKSHSLPHGDSCDINVGQALISPQSANQTQLTQPLFPHLLINPHMAIIIEQRVKVNQKARILELKQRNHEEHCSDNLYAISIKEGTTYPCPKLHSASTKERSIRRIQMKPYTVFKYKSLNIL